MYIVILTRFFFKTSMSEEESWTMCVCVGVCVGNNFTDPFTSLHVGFVRVFANIQGF